MRAAPDPGFLAFQEALAGRYSLERELGRGGMGVVYLAREVRLDRPVALKLLPAEYAARRELRERFLREARTAARLSHPHIVPIHSVDEVGDFVFMVMSYVEGQTLEQRVRERGPLPVTEAARIMREVAWALAYAHAQGIVHRDIKPANILLEAGSGRALVSDFGIAHVTGQAGLTGAAELMGTAEYMSPEQASGQPLDGRSDLYALGIVGYFIVSGRLPFEGPTLAATLAKQLTQAPAPLSSVAPEVPLAVTQAIDRCLAKDPAARFADGEQLADAIGRTLEDRTRVPQALRLFNEQVGEAIPWLVGMEIGAVYSFIGAAITGMDSIFGAGEIMLLTGSTLAAAPVAMLLYWIRRMLRSGYGHDELVRSLRLEFEERREALAAERIPEPTTFERFARRFAIGGMWVSLSSIAYYFVGQWFPAYETVVLPILVGLGMLTLGAGFYSATKDSDRNRKPSARMLKFWESRFGRALFKLAGLRLEIPLGAGASYRPTEFAIGLAADRLFEELPADVRKSLGELPLGVRTLEQHAEKMRARVAELSGILNDVEQQRGRRLAEVEKISE
ncbi:MAG: serine/threonine-protein kinase, partial [Gemmatimonadota bacterium]